MNWFTDLFPRPSSTPAPTRPIPPLAPVPPARLVTAQDVQAKLSAMGLLDPPVDGVLGAVSRWAIGEVAGPAYTGDLTPAVIAAISAAKPFPLAPGNDLAGRIVRAMQAGGYWINRHPNCCNIFYGEGVNPDGTRNDNRANYFNDVRWLFRIQSSGVPQIIGAWEGTTEPSTRWTEDPMNPAGAARIAFGQYKAWSVGRHHTHEALVQTAPITVFRDFNKDYRRDGDKRDTGLFGVNQHWGYDLPRNDMQTSSAGCLVGRSTSGHRDFMSRVKNDARYRASGGSYRFMTTIMPGTALAA